tara:strand:- start:2728 stop:2904 length:177 start_codon:yes stop_codon:yes gene_type:complete
MRYKEQILDEIHSLEDGINRLIGAIANNEATSITIDNYLRTYKNKLERIRNLVELEEE